MKFIKKVFHHELISGSTYFFIGSMATNVFAFLFNLFVARRLSAIDYGIYASLLSLFSLIILIPQSFSTTIVQFATGYFSKNEKEKAKKLYKQATIFLTLLGIVFFVAILFATPLISNFLHITNIWFIVIVGVLIIFSYINMINTSYLQGLLQFGFLSFVQALGALVKLLVGIVLVILGYGIFGALGAILISTIVTIIVAVIRLRFLFTPNKNKTIVNIWELVKYALPTMLTVIALSSFVSTDVILAKHFLSGSEAGLYAGLSLVGKVIFYFTGIIPAVMFPILIRRYTKGHAVHNTFYLGLLLVAIPSLLLTIFYFLFPNFVINLFLGGKQYLYAASDIGYMALFLSFYSIMTVMVNFFLSLKQTKVVFPVVLMALLQIILLFLFHHSLFQMITVSLFVSGVLTIWLALYYLYHFRVVKTYDIELIHPAEV